jgi:hypothetical protein
MHEIDEIAHVIQLAIAPVFLLTGVASLLNVLSGRLARIIDRARRLEDRLYGADDVLRKPMIRELDVLAHRGKLMYRAITLSTIAALLVCFVVATLFISSMVHFSVGKVVATLFVAAMISSIGSLMFFVREVFLAIQTFEIGLPRETKTTPPS